MWHTPVSRVPGRSSDAPGLQRRARGRDVMDAERQRVPLLRETKACRPSQAPRSQRRVWAAQLW